MRKNLQDRAREKFESKADKIMNWIGSTQALLIHTIIFLFCFSLPLFGVPADEVLLALTTILSIEAVYLAIFIQIAVNRTTADIEEIQEDVEEIQKDVDEIQEDVDEIQEDIEEIEEDSDKAVQSQQTKDNDTLTSIQQTLIQLQRELEELKKK